MDLSPEAAALLDSVRRARSERRLMKNDPSSEVPLGEAYLIQAELRGSRELAGYKLGLLSPAKQAQMGISAPILGTIYSEMLLSSPVSLGRFIQPRLDRKSTRLNSSHANISYAVFCLKKKTTL